MIDPKQEEFANQRKSVLESHLQDFEIGLQRRISTAKHVRLTMSRIRRVVRGCEFETIGDISADDVECFLSEARMEGEFGHKTYNHYVQAFEQFCSWLMAKGRVSFNPVVGLERLNCETDVRHRRRALSPDEFEKLVLSAQTSDKLIQCYDGETRAKIYVLSNMTGLRRTELASLTPSSFKLQVHPATLTVAAKNSKHRKLDVLPLHPDLIVMLREWLVSSIESTFPPRPPGLWSERLSCSQAATGALTTSLRGSAPWPLPLMVAPGSPPCAPPESPPPHPPPPPPSPPPPPPHAGPSRRAPGPPLASPRPSSPRSCQHIVARATF